MLQRQLFILLWSVTFIYTDPTRYNRNHHPGDNENSLQPLTPGGPNICKSRHRTFCCPGWSRHNILGLCIIPVCSRTCGTGRCIQPNMCLCEDGRQSTSCSSNQLARHGNDGKSCRAICMNGGSCIDGKCSCTAGYSGEFCTEPICLEPCKNGGRCIGPDRCACVYGFTGLHCEIDYRTGPCYTGIRGTLCTNQLEGVVCTKTLCCATVGKAWGHPCEHCPSRLDCEIGFLKNQKTGECVGK